MLTMAVVDNNARIRAKKEASKEPKNFKMPTAIVRLFDFLVGEVEDGNNWLVISAGVIALARMPLPERRKLYALVSGADVNKDYTDLLRGLPLDEDGKPREPGGLRGV